MVAAVDQIVHRVDDRQAGPYVRFEQELDAAVTGCFFQFDIVFV